MTGRQPTKPALSAGLIGVCAIVLALAAGPLAALPVLFAFLPLLAGRYLGVEGLERLIEARFPAARPRSPQRIGTPRSAFAASLPRGGSLLATSLAKRPPPPAQALS